MVLSLSSYRMNLLKAPLIAEVSAHPWSVSSVDRANRAVRNALRCCSLSAATPSSTPYRKLPSLLPISLWRSISSRIQSPLNSNQERLRLPDQITSSQECLTRSRMVSRGKNRESPDCEGPDLSIRGLSKRGGCTHSARNFFHIQHDYKRLGVPSFGWKRVANFHGFHLSCARRG